MSARRKPGTQPEPRPTAHASEDNLSAACQNRVRVVWEGEVLKTHGGPHQRKGEPDLLICLRGRLVACELKQPGNRPTVLQAKRLLDWSAAGALAGWVTTEVELDALLARAGDPSWVNPQLAELRLIAGHAA